MGYNIKTCTNTEDRRAQAEALQASIADQVEQLRDSEQWIRFLDFARSFHRYSINNLLLILSQQPTSSRVAGFRQWQVKGRQVRKGERAIRIFGYAQKHLTAEDSTDKEQQAVEDGQKVITYFPVLSVFDIGQTDLVDPDADDPSTLAQQLTGDDVAGIVDAVTHYLQKQGWTLTRQPISGTANGYTDPATRRVVVDAGVSAAQAAKTALHEAAHVILHAKEDMAEYVEHRGIKETEAESVAYVVAGLLGIDTSRYSIGYVAGWSAGDTATIKTTAARVLHAAHILAEAITDTDSQTHEVHAKWIVLIVLIIIVLLDVLSIH